MTNVKKGDYPMSLISEIKCAKCDRKYSGVRSRCPFCGERLIGRGKSAGGRDRYTLKMLISVMVMSVFVIAAGVLLFTTEVPDAEPPPVLEAPPRPSIPDDLSSSSFPGNHPETPSPEPTPEPEDPEPEPPPTVRNVIITYNGRENTDFTASVGERVNLRVTIVPEGIEEEVIWASSNESFFQVVPTDTQGTSARVTAVGRGTATLTATVGDFEARCTVRVR